MLRTRTDERAAARDSERTCRRRRRRDIASQRIYPITSSARISTVVAAKLEASRGGGKATVGWLRARARYKASPRREVGGAVRVIERALIHQPNERDAKTRVYNDSRRHDGRNERSPPLFKLPLRRGDV